MPEESKRIQAETSRLLYELNGLRPRGAILLRAKDLRKRSNRLGRTIEGLVARGAAAGRMPDADR